MNRIPAAGAFEINAGPAWVWGPDLPAPLGDLVEVVSPTTTAAPTTTTTTTRVPAPASAPAPEPAPAPAPAPEPARIQNGQASWYKGRKGGCAHRTLPLRRVVTVTNVANGRQTRCTVTNRGPYKDGRVIDLTKATFAELAPVSKGVINVRIEW